ncbi:MAG: gamma-glutamylcyclotransferase [Caldilineaceae bacterium]
MTSSQVDQSEKLFVYGTLRPPRAGTARADSPYFPQIAAHLIAHVPARLPNADLYDLGLYPAAVPGAGVLIGDLLTVAAAALPIADRIEGHPTFYQRTKVTVQTADGECEAWVYWAPSGILLGRRRIESGDWFQRNSNHINQTETAVHSQSDPTPTDENASATLRALVQRFAEAECSWLSTVRPDLRPQSSPIWHVWHGGRAYVVTRPDAVKSANIELNPRVTIAHPDPKDPVIIEGWAIEAPAMRDVLQPLFQAKYNWDIATDAAYTTVLEITPTKLMAWGQYGEGRWTGEQVMNCEW